MMHGKRSKLSYFNKYVKKVLFIFSAHDSADKYFNADKYKDSAAENGRLSGQVCAEFFADVHAAGTYDKGNCADDQRLHDGFGP